MGAAAFCMVAAAVWGGAEPALQAADRHRDTARRVLPAEFEKTGSVLFGWEEENAEIQQLQLRMIGAISRQTPVLLLVRNAGERRRATALAKKANVLLAAVTIQEVPLNSIWARDYGPLVLRMPPVARTVARAAGRVPATAPHRFLVIDTEYPDVERPDDDAIPTIVGQLCGMPVRELSLTLQGGNLLSNGAGLYLTTKKTLTENAQFDRKPRDVARILKTALGASQLIFLEELLGEPNGHVDMFATFVAVNTVVVGEYSAADDPVNAAILDRNAARLAALRTSAGPLRVVRIPMPKRNADIWPTYTNVLYANGVLLMPTYVGVPPRVEARARGIYQKLLPKTKIVGIDCSTIIESGGALHCMTMNLPVAPPKGRMAIPRVQRQRRLLVGRRFPNAPPGQLWPPPGAIRGQPPRDTRRNPFVAVVGRLAAGFQDRWSRRDAAENAERFSVIAEFRKRWQTIAARCREGVQTGIRLYRHSRANEATSVSSRGIAGADPAESLRALGDEYEFDTRPDSDR